PYDAIHVGAATPTIPEPLIAQLARPGRMFIPVDKDKDGDVTKEVIAVSIVCAFDGPGKQKPW
ncbi:hypothetical protein C8J57DRAFT_1271122, partial [Mycena rebaudengoi]